MDLIRVKLVDDKTHQNIKLFLLRLILNCSDAFRPFAKLLGRDLLQLVASSSTWPGGQCVNYFSLDLIVMLLSWQVLSLLSDGSFIASPFLVLLTSSKLKPGQI